MAALPRAGELSRLPLRAVVAYSARCARRLQPLFVLGDTGPGAEQAVEERATRIAEKFARGRSIDENDAWEAAARADGAARAGDEGDDISGAADFGAAKAASYAGAAAAYASAYAAARKADREPNPDYAAAATYAAAETGQYAAAVDAADADREASTCFHDWVAAAARADFNMLTTLALGVYPELGRPIDPSESGPLGPLWVAGEPEWYRPREEREVPSDIGAVTSPKEPIMFSGRSLFHSDFPDAPPSASSATGQESDDAGFDRIIADLIARRGSKPLVVIDLAYALIADIASDEHFDDATANRQIAELWDMISWADTQCEETTIDRREVRYEVKPATLFRAGLAPAMDGNVNTVSAIPPLPTPGKPDSEIVAALTAWSGDPAQVIASLAIDLDGDIGLDVSEGQHERLSPRLNRLVEWAATRHRERPLHALRDYHAHKAAIQSAIDRYGY